MRLAALLRLADIFGRVVTGSFGGGDNTVFAIFGATDSLLFGCDGLFSSGLFRLFDALVEAAFGEDLGAGKASNAGDEFLASGHL